VYLHRQRSFAWLVVAGLIASTLPVFVNRQPGVGVLVLLGAAVLALVAAVHPRRFAHTAFAVLVIGSILAAVTIWSAPVDVVLLPRDASEIVSGQAFGSDVRVLTPLFNITGALALLFGALVSAEHYLRTRGTPMRVASNVLIAIGAVVPSLTSGLTRFGLTSAFYVGELAGIACIVLGFALSGAPGAAPGPARPRPSSS
jgi:hypothetical protein